VAGTGALLVSFVLAWGLIEGLGEFNRDQPQPIQIAVRVVTVTIRPEPPRDRAVPASTVRQTFMQPAKIMAPPMPELAVAAARNQSPSLSSATTDEHIPVGTDKPNLPSATPPPDYLSLLLAHLNAYKRYPYNARLHHEEGIVRLRFVMDRAGHVLSHQIAESSGFPELDDEANAMIQEAQPLPPVPANYPGTTLDLVLPLVFSLR
jgi:periplasmic protein TonB